MKNLDNLQLQELTIEEQVNTDGGFFFIKGLIAGAVATGIIEYISSTFFRRP